MAIVAAVVLSLAVGVLVYVFLMRKMTGEMVLAAVLTTIALGILLRGADGADLVGARSNIRCRRSASSNPAIALPGGARISTCAALIVLTTVARLRRLFAFLRFGRWGVRMRAAGQNPLLAAQRGINLHAVYALAWGLSTLTGSLAGMLIALDSGLDQTMVIIGLKAFPAALVGGLDSLLGALVGALIVAGAEVLPIHYIDPLLVRRGAVPGADRHADRAAVGPVRHPRGARPCLGKPRASGYFRTGYAQDLALIETRLRARRASRSSSLALLAFR